MRAILSLSLLSLLCLNLTPAEEKEARSIAFEMKEIERGLGVGYAVLLDDSRYRDIERFNLFKIQSLTISPCLKAINLILPWL